MTPLERAARALHDNDPTSEFPWDDYVEGYHDQRRREARIVAEAIREPSSDMVKAATTYDPKDQTGIIAEEAEGCWGAMIDALLAEKP